MQIFFFWLPTTSTMFFFVSPAVQCLPKESFLHLIIPCPEGTEWQFWDTLVIVLIFFISRISIHTYVIIGSKAYLLFFNTDGLTEKSWFVRRFSFASKNMQNQINFWVVFFFMQNKTLFFFRIFIFSWFITANKFVAWISETSVH